MVSEALEIRYSKIGLRDFLIIKEKNTAIASLWRVFLTQKIGKYQCQME